MAIFTEVVDSYRRIDSSERWSEIGWYRFSVTCFEKSTTNME